MICSMTGFSAVTVELETGSISLEIRSLNHRYLDLQLRLQDEFRMLEPVVREAIAASVVRGKVECRINFIPRQSPGMHARLNIPLLQQLAQWNAEIRGIFPAAADLGVADILRWHGMLESNALPADELHGSVIQLLQRALLEFNAARTREGEKLKDFLLHRVKQIQVLSANLAPLIPSAIGAFESKLRTRLLDALGNLDDERILQEVSLFASKIDVDEELSRLHTHLCEMERVLEKGGSVGKRLDFLMQELHREANTLGSKSVDAEVSRASMEMKILIEQMREQIQNLE